MTEQEKACIDKFLTDCKNMGVTLICPETWRQGKGRAKPMSALFLEVKKLHSYYTKFSDVQFHKLVKLSCQYQQDQREKINKNAGATRIIGKPLEELREDFLKCVYFSEGPQSDGYLVDPSNYDIRFVPVAQIRKCLPMSESDPQAMDFWRNSSYYGIKDYDPYSKEVIYLRQGRGHTSVYVLNTYVPPFWYEIDIPDRVELMPQLKKFFEHLFPEQECREYVFDWCANSLQNKNPTYLFMMGHQGIGKGVFCQLLQNLHGHENTNMRDSEKAYSQYEGDIIDKTLLLFDEICIKNSMEENFLKSFANPRRGYRVMHSDSSTQNCYSNIVITLNPNSIITHMDASERRYSLPFLTETPMIRNDKFMPEEIDELVNSQELKINLAQYLLSRPISRNMNVAYKHSEKRREVNFTTLPNIYKMFFRALITRAAEKKISTESNDLTYKMHFKKEVVNLALRDMQDTQRMNDASFNLPKIMDLFSKRPDFGRIDMRPGGGYSIYLKDKLTVDQLIVIDPLPTTEEEVIF